MTRANIGELLPDAQQMAFINNLLDQKSETFGNYYRSALKAGFSEGYARNIKNEAPQWLRTFLEGSKDNKRLKRAEKKLDEILEIPAVDQEGKHDNGLIANQIKVATLYAKGLGKNKYSERYEHTGEGGKDLTIKVISYGNNDTPPIRA